MLSSDTKYAAYLVFASKSDTYGFDCLPAEGSATAGGDEGEKRSICLDPEGAQRRREPLDQNTLRPRRRDDGWREVELGEYFVGGGENSDLQVSCMEVVNGIWKRGLVIQGIEIGPKRE